MIRTHERECSLRKTSTWTRISAQAIKFILESESGHLLLYPVWIRSVSFFILLLHFPSYFFNNVAHNKHENWNLLWFYSETELVVPLSYNIGKVLVLKRKPNLYFLNFINLIFQWLISHFTSVYFPCIQASCPRHSLIPLSLPPKK